MCSLLLANIFLHHVFDEWFTTRFPALAFERYADDLVVHCRTEKEARYVHDKIAERMRRCGLEVHAGKTKIVYCKDDRRTESHEHHSFDFLGYCFRPRSCRAKTGNLYARFSPAISSKAKKRIGKQIRQLRIHLWVGASLESIAQELNPVIRGWLEYYGKYHRSELRFTLQRIDVYLIRSAQGKFRRLKGHRLKAVHWLSRVRQRQPRLFAHWAAGMAWA